MKYKGHDVEVVSWLFGRPWPESISYDGVQMEYAGVWASRAARQIIYYRQPGTARLYEVARSVFLR